MENDVVEKKVVEQKEGLSRKESVSKGYKSIKVYIKPENKTKLIEIKNKHNFIGFDTTVDYILENWRE